MHLALRATGQKSVKCVDRRRALGQAKGCAKDAAGEAQQQCAKKCQNLPPQDHLQSAVRPVKCLQACGWVAVGVADGQRRSFMGSSIAASGDSDHDPVHHAWWRMQTLSIRQGARAEKGALLIANDVFTQVPIQ